MERCIITYYIYHFSFHCARYLLAVCLVCLLLFCSSRNLEFCLFRAWESPDLLEIVCVFRGSLKYQTDLLLKICKGLRNLTISRHSYVWYLLKLLLCSFLSVFFFVLVSFSESSSSLFSFRHEMIWTCVNASWTCVTCELSSDASVFCSASDFCHFALSWWPRNYA